MAAFFKRTKKQKKNQFPETLSGFGYEFSKDGKIINSTTGEGFQFAVKEGDLAYNQKHYEALGEVVTNEMYKLLETECRLKRAPVPHNAKKKDNSTFIFLSDDALSNPDKLLVLIHGSGVVRAGQWSRRLIINGSLKSGSQIPFIQKAQKEGYGILVTNTNDNHRGGIDKIEGSECPESHALSVWKHYIHGAKAKHVAIIAHSYGGCVLTSLYTHEKEEFMKRVFAVALTDSVHYWQDPKPFNDLLQVSKNWVCSEDPLDTPVKTSLGDITRVSAGVNVHEQTSWASFSSIFKFLHERLTATKDNAETADNVDEREGNTCQDLQVKKDFPLPLENFQQGSRSDVPEETLVHPVKEGKEMRMDT